MEREIKPYILKKSAEDSQSAKLSLDYAAALNPQQLAAVTAADGPSLVIAGAGSGKTRTLIYRVAYLIDKGVDPTTILLLTFTRKAAQEMLQRAGLLIGARSEKVAGGTFHSVANSLLRRYGRPIDLEPGFTILDRGDAEDLIALVAVESTRNLRDRYELTYLNVTSSSMAVPHATVKIRIDGGEEHLGHAVGDGMVDACFKASAI